MCLLIKAKNHVYDDSDSDSATAYAMRMVPLSPLATHVINKCPSYFRSSRFHLRLEKEKGMFEMPGCKDQMPKKLLRKSFPPVKNILVCYQLEYGPWIGPYQLLAIHWQQLV